MNTKKERRYVIRYFDEYDIYHYMKKRNGYTTDFFDAGFTYILYLKNTLKYKTLKRAFDKINNLGIDNLEQFEIVEFDVTNNAYHSNLTGKVYKYRDLLLYYKLKNIKK